MNLTLDFGNTRVKWAIFDHHTQVVTGNFIDHPDPLFLDSLQRFPIDHMGYLSTRGNVAEWVNQWVVGFPVTPVKQTMPLPIHIHYKNKFTLGMDRIAAATGAVRRFPAANLLVIDLGTCITADFVDYEGSFRGGNISPGIRMRLQAMHTFTASLPEVEPLVTSSLFGNSTIEAMQNGAVQGACLELEGLISLAGKNIPGITCVVTGGDAHYFEMFTNYKIFAAPNLVLEGVNEILQYNANKK